MYTMMQPSWHNNSDTNKQNHNVQTHKYAASAVYDSTKYYEVWNKIKRYAITVKSNFNKLPTPESVKLLKSCRGRGSKTG
jgi:hypothetical protein